MPLNRRRFLGTSLAFATMSHQLRPAFAAPASQDRELWFKQPAHRWLEALPLGNGRIGGMVYGCVSQEKIALSESTVWSGAPGKDEVNPTALSNLAHIRELYFAGKYEEAQALCEKHLLGHAKNYGTNLPLPDLRLSFDHASPSLYKRSLNIDDAIARVTYRIGTTNFTREAFVSHPDKVLVIHLTADKPSALNLRVGFGPTTLPAQASCEAHDLILNGHAYEKMHSSGYDGVRFKIHARVVTESGSVIANSDSTSIQQATSATILVAIATDFVGNDPDKACTKALSDAASKCYSSLRPRHIADHRALFHRVSLDLGPSFIASSHQPTDIRRNALEAGVDDPALFTLFFDYGRYLTIAGSREDSPLPLALQGIWNDGLASSMGWTDDFHLDINTQQNYWAAEVCNLGECQSPLFKLIDGLRVSGHVTAHEMYGAPGWVAHTITNAWGYSAPGWGTGWGLCISGGVWLAQQLWEHYAFTGDTAFLAQRAYPALREAAEFFLAYMTPEPTHGWLVTGPSDSPENSYTSPTGAHIQESMGNTFDRVYVHALYAQCIEASQTLKVDPELRQRLEAAIAKLPPFQVGRHGQLQEWLLDYDDAIPNHRHTSHLSALYPEQQISPRATPDLARATEVTIERRMSAPNWEESEWGRGNLVAYYARLLNGDAAHKHLVGLVAKAADDNLMTFSSAGVAGATDNICAIDGNTAGTAGIAEMLLQSRLADHTQPAEITLLPALPKAWPTGSFRGLRARGGYQVDATWHSGKLVSATITSNSTSHVTIRYGEATSTIELHTNTAKTIAPSTFHTKSV